MTLNEDIKEAIKKHVPEHVSKAIQERLSEADRIIANADDQRKLLESTDKNYQDAKQHVYELQQHISSMRQKEKDLNQREESLNTRDKQLVNRNTEITIREKVIELREKHAEERVQQAQQMVAQVFGNNQFKYTRTTNSHVALPGMEKRPPQQGTQDNNWHQDFGDERINPRVEPVTNTETVEGEGEPPS